MRCCLIFLLFVTGVCAQNSSPSPEPEPTPMELPPTPIGEVFAVRNASMISNYQIDDAAVKKAVDRLLIGVTGKGTVVEAWKSLVRPSDRVGLKVSAVGREFFATHRAVVEAVVGGLREAGISSDRIIVWDRNADDLKAAGYFDRVNGYRVRWPYPGKGYAPKNVYASTVLGQLIWGDLDFTRRYSHFEQEANEKPKDNLSSNSHFARVLIDDVDKVINLPVLSSHSACGLAGALYNMTIPNIDNWRRFTSGMAESDPAIPEIYSEPAVMDKVVLNIMDGLVGQFAGGPEFQPNYAVEHGTLYASRDPVALDTVALKEIDRWRLRARMRSASMEATYLQTAREYGLGNAGNANVRNLP